MVASDHFRFCAAPPANTPALTATRAASDARAALAPAAAATFRAATRTAAGPLGAGATRRGAERLVASDGRTAAEEGGSATPAAAKEADRTRAEEPSRAAPAPPPEKTGSCSRGTESSTGAANEAGEAKGPSGAGEKGGGRAFAGGAAAVRVAKGKTATPVSPAASAAAARRGAATNAEPAAWRADATSRGTPASGGLMGHWGRGWMSGSAARDTRG